MMFGREKISEGRSFLSIPLILTLMHEIIYNDNYDRNNKLKYMI